MNKKFATTIAVSALLFVVGCAPTKTREGTGEYIDDTVLTTKVKTAIAQDPDLSSFEINVETFKGIVQLSGFVSSKGDEKKAVEVAKGVSGVKEVKDNMQVK